MHADAKKWLRHKADAFLTSVGLQGGQTVLDFGCNEGNYTLAAARIVGEAGKVYALDKDKDSLKKLTRRARKKRRGNIEPLHVKEDENIPLASASVDAVLLYDTLHGGYFPQAAQRRKVLKRIYRVLKAGGLLSCYPTHLKQFGMTFDQILAELTDAGWRCQSKHRRTLVHDGNLVRGTVFSFVKPRRRRARF